MYVRHPTDLSQEDYFSAFQTTVWQQCNLLCDTVSKSHSDGGVEPVIDLTDRAMVYRVALQLCRYVFRIKF